ncbi:MAG: hypothetical protein ABSE50_06625 [Xanthobacteraceae bacterium]
MRKLATTLTAAALALGAMVLTVNAQTQAPGAANLHAQIQNATPIVKKAACNGMTGSHGCGGGYVWACGPYGGNCRCVRC